MGITVKDAVRYFGANALETKYASIFPNRLHYHYECAARYERLYERECLTEEQLREAVVDCGLIFNFLEIRKKIENRQPLGEGEEMLMTALRLTKKS